MSEPFPSKVYLELCTQPEVADRLREEWEKRELKPYDVVFVTGQLKLILKPEVFGDEPDGVAYIYALPIHDPVGVMRGAGLEWHARAKLVWLPRLDQLIEMLEERGYSAIEISSEPGDVGVMAHLDDVDCAEGFGPCPATALLRAYLSLDPVGEVVKDG